MCWGGWHRWRKMNHCWELSQHPADEVLSSLSRDLLKDFLSPLEVRWLFRCGRKMTVNICSASRLAAVWDFAPPAYDWFLICFHTSLAVPKSRNKRAEEQQKCQDQAQRSPPTGLTFVFLVLFLCRAGLHVMRGFIDLIPCSYLGTISFGLLLLQIMSHQLISAVSCNFSVSVSEVFLPMLPDNSHIPNNIYSWNEILLDQTPRRFQSFGATQLPGLFPASGYHWPTKEVGSGLANSCAVREVFKPSCNTP